MDVRPEAAEAICVFALVFAGAGAIMANATTGALGHVGGVHFNPAITIALAATGHFPWYHVAGYVLAITPKAPLVALGPIPLEEAR